MITLQNRLTVALPLMTKAHKEKVRKLLQLQKRLEDIRKEIKVVIGRESQLLGEFDGYTSGWLSAFATDEDQCGSIASLIASIVDDYVDEDAQP